MKNSLLVTKQSNQNAPVQSIYNEENVDLIFIQKKL